MAEVNYSVHGRRVFVRYKNLVADAITTGLTAEELIAAANEELAKESEAAQLPEMAELMSLKTRIAKELFVAEAEESAESGEEAPKYVVVASLRYMAKADESESL